MSLLHHHALIKGSVVGFIPLNAAVLFNHAATTPTRFTKTAGANWEGFFYRDVNYQLNSEIKETIVILSSGWQHMYGFYNKTLTNPTSYFNLNYSAYLHAGDNKYIIEERGINMGEVGVVLVADVVRLKRTATCEYFKNEDLLYTSLQDFAVGQFGGVVAAGVNIRYIDECYYKL